jgi:hypothetical protein
MPYKGEEKRGEVTIIVLGEVLEALQIFSHLILKNT